MALDFPNAPTVGQIFPAPNSVNYQWDGVLWRAVGGALAPVPGGDFMAMRTTALSLTGSLAVLTLNSVVAGNSGNWFNPATGRLTPPVGRHFIRGSMSAYNSGGTAGSVDFQLRKNGVTILDRASETTVGGSAQQLVVAATVDANGTDYFELMALTGASAGDISNLTFQAFPISGIKGPPGDSSTSRALYHEVIAAAGSPVELIVNVPANARSIEIEYELVAASAANDTAVWQLMQGGTVVNTAVYSTQFNQAVGTGAPVGTLVQNATSSGLSAGLNWMGFIKGTLAPGGRTNNVMLSVVNNVLQSASRVTGSHGVDIFIPRNTITGVRFFVTNGWAAGSVARSWVMV
jgi:hypothetical protein